MFEGFELEWIDVGGVTLRVRHGGSGPGLLLLHGHPRTHATWHRVAPLLADGWTIVCPDLRGYGQSTKPPTTSDHEPYSKRAMARDCAALMHVLGHERYAVVGHDRGAYVAQRLALDYPEVVTHLGFLGGVPIGEALARCDARFARAWWHWFFLGQTDKAAERVISADPEAWYRVDAEAMGEEAYADLRQALLDPQVVHAMCEDYRAGLGIDRLLDDSGPHRRPPDQLPGACRMGGRRRHRGTVGRPNSHLAQLGERRTRRPDRLWTPHGRRSPRRARSRVTRLPEGYAAGTSISS